MIILAIDLGDIRTGLAYCDKNEILACPLETIIESNQNILIQKTKNIIIKYKIELIVVGNPINMNGSCGPRSEKCVKFSEKLKNISKVPVILRDERQTTLLANRLLIESNTKKTKKKKLVDAVAATLILNEYLDFRKNNPS